MLRKDFPIPPKNIAVFARKENYDKIVDFKLWDEQSEEHKKWIDNPYSYYEKPALIKALFPEESQSLNFDKL